MAKKESKPEIERSYNVPLRKGFHDTAGYKKSAKAMRTLQEFLRKHMKTEDVLIGRRLNEFIWKHGIKNPPHHVKVHVWKKDDQVKAELEGYDFTGAVRSEKKKEPETMKEKLAAKLGVDTTKPEAEKKTDEKKESAPAKQETAETAKPEVKKEKKAAAPKKKEAEKE
jgi:large subunit ribosomal protein L31e